MIKIILGLLLAASLEAQQIKGYNVALQPMYPAENPYIQLKQNGADHVRVWLLTLWTNGQLLPWQGTCLIEGINRACTDSLIDRNIEALKVHLAMINAAGLKAIIDLHWFYSMGDKNAVTTQVYRQEFRYTWTRYAQEFGQDPRIIALDLLNEPADYNYTQEYYYNEMVKRTVADIRALGVKKPIIIETPGNTDCRTIRGYEPPIKNSNIWYSVHPYDFLEGNKPFTALSLNSRLQMLEDWQIKYGVNIHIGEFGIYKSHPQMEQYWKLMRNWLNKTKFDYEVWNNDSFIIGSNSSNQ